jgi:hypothetical protein
LQSILEYGRSTVADGVSAASAVSLLRRVVQLKMVQNSRTNVEKNISDLSDWNLPAAVWKKRASSDGHFIPGRLQRRETVTKPGHK